MKKISLFSIVLIIFGACTQEKTVDKNTALAIRKIDTLTYSYDSVVVYSKNIVKNGQSSDTTKAAVSFPKFTNVKLNQYIERQIFNFIGKDEQVTSYNDIANSFIRGYDDFYTGNKDRNQAWWLTIDIVVLHQKSNYIGLRYMNSDYSGGAHPNTYFSYINFNPKTSKPITLDSLIEPSRRKKLTHLGEMIFRRNEKLGKTETLEGKYFFKDDKFALPENFYICPKGIVFLYNPYEIKPYVDGTTELIIPFSSLKGFTKPNTYLSTTK